jgi:hypothetical protein
MRRLTVILGLLFSSLLVLPTAASAATAIEYGLIAAGSPSADCFDCDWN